jgi:mono/diheme cytochrome c family protein
MRRGALGMVVALAMAAGCGGDDEAETGGGGGGGGATEAPAQQASQGKELFSSSCGGCHTLADAGTSGMVGPNLDELGPSREQVLAAIKAGPGPMPENLYEGAEAEAVADYVSGSAGQ